MSDLTIADVLNANLGTLAEAADHWSGVAGRLAQLDSWFDGSVAKTVRAHWSGALSSTVAAGELQRSNRQLTDATTEARALSDALRKAHDDFQSAKNAVRKALDDVGAAGMTWREDPRIGQWIGGVRVEWPPLPAGAVMDDQEFTRYKTEREQTAARLADGIGTALAAASAADAAAAQALTRVVGGNDDRFNTASTGDPFRDVARATELMNKIPGLSSAERIELESLLNANDGNDLFAETLLTSIGPRKLLEVARELQPEAAPTPGRNVPAAKNDQPLIDLLGRTLAAASEGLAKNSTWMDGLKEAGKEAITSGSVPPVNLQTKYGYQDLSRLLRNGEFATPFLNAVGPDMYEFDRKSKGWAIGSADPNEDAITGLMTAYANSPEAATEFFKGAKGAERIEYLMERTYPKDRFVNIPPQLDALGEALDAATTGKPPTEASMSALQNTVDYLGKGRPPEIPDVMQDSVTDIMAHNIVSVNARLTNSMGEEFVFPGGQAEPIARFGTENGIRVIAALSGDEENIARIAQAQDAYTAAGLAAIGHYQNNEVVAVKEHLDNSAQVYGILTGSVVEETLAAQAAKDGATAESRQQIADWTSQAIGTAVGYIPLVGPVLETEIGIATDSVMGSVGTPDGSASAMRRSEILHRGSLGMLNSIAHEWSKEHPYQSANPVLVNPYADIDVNYNNGIADLQRALYGEPGKTE
ncbi:hypothetical protein GCM10023205_00350 [Yinghuangia aomiensis]|uniref:WXG100 family type VII secretion target n=1 Tax=Yinghuangia aomiensis TaxID=676205 RepID=A0ABP9GI69_9ACTN